MAVDEYALVAKIVSEWHEENEGEEVAEWTDFAGTLISYYENLVLVGVPDEADAAQRHELIAEIEVIEGWFARFAEVHAVAQAIAE